MKRKILTVLLSIVALLCCAFGLLGCNTSPDNEGNQGSASDGTGGNQSPGSNDGNGNENSGSGNESDNTGSGSDNQGSGNQGSGSGNQGGQITIPDKPTYTKGLEYALTANKTAYKCTGLWTAIDKNVVIATEYEGLPVTEIAERAFYKSADITSVTVSANITKIGDFAFEDCPSLSTVYWNAVKCTKSGTYTGSIVKSIFRSCPNLTKAVIADNVTYLPEFAFYGCSKITEIVIPDSVTHVDEDVFTGCSSLETVTVGKKVNEIYKYAFKNCTGIKRVNYTGNLESWCKINFSTYDSNPVAFAHNLYINNKLLTNASIPNGVTSIGNYAFYRCNITSLTIPASVTAIGNSAFYGCNITALSVPASVNSIAASAFYDCTALKSVALSDGLTSIGGKAFGGCSGLTSFTIPKTVTSLGANIVQNCTNLKTIYWNAANCSAPSSSIPVSDSNGVTEIVLGASVTDFSRDFNKQINTFNDYKNLKKITVNTGNTRYSGQSGILYNKNKTEIVYVPAGIEGEIAVPDGITEIGATMFGSCSKITSITLPESIKAVGTNAFNNGLNDIRYKGGLADWCKIKFDSYPLEYAENLYINDVLITSVIVPDGVTEVTCGAFTGSKNITGISIPDSVTYIQEGALKGCTALTSVSLPFVGTAWKVDSFNVGYPEFGSLFGYEENYSRYNVNVPSSLKTVEITGGNAIDSHAFEDCYYIEKITLPDTVTAVKTDAFRNCRNLAGVYYTGDIKSWLGIEFSNEYSNPLYRAHKLYIDNNLLTELNVPEGTAKISSYAFYGCSDLTSISIPDTVTSIGGYAFNDTGYLKNESNWEGEVLYIGKHLIKAKSTLSGTYTVKDGTVTIAGRAFSEGYSYFNVSGIVIPGSVVSIGNSAFYNCISLGNVTISEGVKSIGSNAFYGCDSLTSITIPVSVTEIGLYGLGRCSYIGYNGTMSQWANIKKDSSWTVSSYVTVHCSDGSLDRYGKEV